MKKKLVIEKVEAFEVTIPIHAPIRHSYGVHEAFTRTIVRVYTDDGLVGLAETAAASSEVMAQSGVIIGLSAFEIGLVKMRVGNRFYWSNNPLVVSALEMACIDILGKAQNVPAHQILGGPLRESIDMAAYLFYRYGENGNAAIDSPESMVQFASELIAAGGYGTLKLKGGVLEPAIEMETIKALREAFPKHNLRFDPNAAWTPATAIRWSGFLESVQLEYYEDPAPGIAGMAQVRSRTRLPLATNMVAVDFRDIWPSTATNAIDIVLSDPWYWGGATNTQSLGMIASTLGISLGMHSGIETGIGMAIMAHVGVTIPNLTLAVDAHYHHLTDDVIVGDMLLPIDGKVAPPDGPGWGVSLDEAKVAQYRELHESGKFANLYVEGSSGHGADRWRKDWYPVMPAW